MRAKFVSFGLLVAILSGCSLTVPRRLDQTFPGAGPLIPDANFQLSPTMAVSLEKLITWGGTAAVAYLILDPLAPNWNIEEARFPGNHVHLSLHMKRFYAGGAGEARVIFHRRAKELMREGGFDAYQVIEYNEGMESSVLGSQRVGEGVILLTKSVG
jgi:hypothetical protein